MENPYMINPSLDVENNEELSDMLRCGDMVLAMAYVPMQMWRDVYDSHSALARGTQFKELDKPFFGEDVWG